MGLGVCRNAESQGGAERVRAGTGGSGGTCAPLGSTADDCAGEERASLHGSGQVVAVRGTDASCGLARDALPAPPRERRRVQRQQGRVARVVAVPPGPERAERPEAAGARRERAVGRTAEARVGGPVTAPPARPRVPAAGEGRPARRPVRRRASQRVQAPIGRVGTVEGILAGVEPAVAAAQVAVGPSPAAPAAAPAWEAPAIAAVVVALDVPAHLLAVCEPEAALACEVTGGDAPAHRPVGRGADTDVVRRAAGGAPPVHGGVARPVPVVRGVRRRVLVVPGGLSPRVTPPTGRAATIARGLPALTAEVHPVATPTLPQRRGASSPRTPSRWILRDRGSD